MLDLVRNPEDRFSHNEAHMMSVLAKSHKFPSFKVVVEYQQVVNSEDTFSHDKV